MELFDRTLHRQYLRRAAQRTKPVDFLWREMAERLMDRLDAVRRDFPLALDLGWPDGILQHRHCEQSEVIQSVRQERCWIASPSARNDDTKTQHVITCNPINGNVIADEEWLPFAENRFDLAVSVGSLHWVNDLPGTLAQIHRLLKPDGLMLVSFPGGETLKELRDALTHAEINVSGGTSPRVIPFVDIRDAGALLQRAGFQLPVADSDTLTVTYDHPLKLLADLRSMGQANALVARSRQPLKRELLQQAMNYYMERYADSESRIPATFEIITMTGWKR